MTRRMFSPEEELVMVSEYNDDEKTVQAIAKAHGCSWGPVHRILEKHNVAFRQAKKATNTSADHERRKKERMAQAAAPPVPLPPRPPRELKQCPICGRTPCQSPQPCGRHLRARAQHGWKPK